MYYSTLWYSNNSLIRKYQAKFLLKLQNLWRNSILLELPPDDFLLYPDIHGLILASHRIWNPDRWSIIGILEEEYFQYKARENTFSYNEEEIIPWTNIALTLDFQNVDATKSTHPDHKKNHVWITFGSIDQVEWQRLFAQSFDIARQVSPGFMEEINSVIRKIIPFDVSIGMHNSGSFSDAIGHLLMSYPTEIECPELALLEAIVHEYNHNKLNLILQTEPLIYNDSREIYYSPYRPDARHIHGIYMGVHALSGAYWVIWNAYSQGIIQLSENWVEKSVLYVLKNGVSLQVLDKYSSLTPLGKLILEEIRTVHHECLRFMKSANIRPEIIAHARTSLISHSQDVQGNYPNLVF